MKIILPLLFLFGPAWSVDYDPKFHIKHRHNKEEKIKKLPEEKKDLRVEASETSEAPLKTTPNQRTVPSETTVIQE